MVMQSIFMYGDLTKYGSVDLKMALISLKETYGKYPVVDNGTVKKIKSGENSGMKD